MKRREIPLLKLVAHWRDIAAELPSLRAHGAGWGEPFCFACGWMPPVRDGLSDSWDRAARWLDKAHLQDWSYAHDDSPANVVPLCHRCHFDMPEFTDRAEAVAWVEAHADAEHTWQLWTDTYLWNRKPTRNVTLIRERARWAEAFVAVLSEGVPA